MLAALVMVGCTSAKKTDNGLVPPGAEFRTGLPFEPGYAQQFGYAHRWARSIKLGDGQSVFAVEIVDDLIITVERPTNIITALNLKDGSLAWKSLIGEPLENFFGPVGDDEYIYVSSNRRMFKLLRRNGQTDGVYELPLPVTMTPLLVDNIAVFGSVNGKVYGFDVEEGYRKWTYGLSGRINSTPLLDGEDVFVVDADGRYVMITANSGAVQWRGSTFGDISADPVLVGREIYLASEDQSLYSFAANTGELRWPAYRSEVALTQTPAVRNDVIFLPEPTLGLTAIDADTGKSIWQTTDVVQPVASVGGKVIAFADKKLKKIEPATGEVLQTVPTREIQMILNGPGNSLILVTPGGEIMRIDPRR
ncbi:MAG: PQQ-binding-like beta-propeller repeat protein [Planctomycetota bacterium]